MASLKGDAFYRTLRTVSDRLGCKAEDLIAVMFLESGLKPASVNPTSNATGLIQFMPSLLKRWELNLADVAKMTDVEQLALVERYLGHELFRGKLGTITSLYLSVFWPAGVGQPDDYTIASRGDQVYAQNAGLDVDGDGHITNKDIAAKMAVVAVREEVKRFVEEFRLVSFIDALPPKDAAERIARLNEYFIDVKPGPKLRALAARVETRPDAEMYRTTNCATYTRWIWAAAGCPNVLCHLPDEEIRARRPAGPVDWDRQIAMEQGALVKYNGNPTSLDRGDGLRYHLVGNDDHMECSLLSKPDKNGIASHAGAGRSGNQITQGVSDIRMSFAFGHARPIAEVVKPYPLLGMTQEVPAPPPEDDAPDTLPSSRDPVIETKNEEESPAPPPAPAPAPVVKTPSKGALLVAALAVIATIAASIYGACQR